VIWTDWKWADAFGETTIEPALPAFAFARSAYAAALAGASTRVADMPYDELEHKGKRFFWPWQWGWGLPKA
jgi:hypothetical protein